MNLNQLIEVYKNKRKQALLDNLSPAYKNKYAFIGVGKHSLSTFYPILSYLNTPLKYILTRHTHFGQQIANKFPNAKAIIKYDEILSDQEVRGVFISAAPKSHFELTRKALENNKNVFVEKPVCYSLQQLNQLTSVKNVHCLVGLQKRYSVINTLVRRKFSRPIYYSGHYAVGSYPEGNPVYELFIHPIDNVSFLFGSATITYIKKITTNNRLTILLQLNHHTGVHGTLELSTGHNWNTPIDSLRLETHNECVYIDYPGYLGTTNKERSFYGIPINKIVPRSTDKKVIYQNTGKLMSLETNTLFESGYFNEVKEFINLVESPNNSQVPNSSIHNLKNTYELLDAIQNY